MSNYLSIKLTSDLIFSLCEIFGTEVIIIRKNEDSSFEENLKKIYNLSFVNS